MGNRLITDFAEVPGKTIARVMVFDRSVGIVFDDDTCLYLEQQEGRIGLGEPSRQLLRYAMEIIDREEFSRIMLSEKGAREAREREKDRRRSEISAKGYQLFERDGPGIEKARLPTWAEAEATYRDPAGG